MIISRGLQSDNPPPVLIVGECYSKVVSQDSADMHAQLYIMLGDCDESISLRPLDARREITFRLNEVSELVQRKLREVLKP